MVANVFVEGAEACSVDVDKGEVIIFITCKDLVGHPDCGVGRKILVDHEVAWIGDGGKWRGKLKQSIHYRVHDYARPSVDEALGTQEWC